VPRKGGTHVTLEHRDWRRLFADAAELTGWFGGGVLAAILESAVPARFGDWLTEEAGFEDVRVIRGDLEQFAREAGVAEEHISLFASSAGNFSRLLLARR
jgi:hypothetical protein